MTPSDMGSMTLDELLEMATPKQKEEFNNLYLGYTEIWGDKELLQEVSKTYKNISPENILCFAGAGEGIYITMRTMLNNQSAETIPLEVCQVSGIELKDENNWQLDIKELESLIQENTKLIAINFPHNPSGTVLSKETLDELINLCRRNDIYLFSDEVFRELERDERDTMPQIADIYEKGLSLNVLSKSYGFPGLRIGWIASKDKEALIKMEKYKHYISLCNSAPSEKLAIIVLQNKEKIIKRNKQIASINLDKLEEFFLSYPKLFQWKRPKGGSIAYVKYLGEDGVENFCKSLIEESGVLLLPASIYKSQLLETSKEHFRIGFGRNKFFETGLEAMKRHIEKKYL
jgi:aspartate/methionine/tyrosine aminotransferase